MEKTMNFTFNVTDKTQIMPEVGKRLLKFNPTQVTIVVKYDRPLRTHKVEVRAQ